MLQVRPRGIGGGGAMFEPHVSPLNPYIMFVACDMTGLYRSDNGGLTWELQDQRTVVGSDRFSVAFHPTADTILGYHPRLGLVQYRATPSTLGGRR